MYLAITNGQTVADNMAEVHIVVDNISEDHNIAVDDMSGVHNIAVDDMSGDQAEHYIADNSANKQPEWVTQQNVMHPDDATEPGPEKRVEYQQHYHQLRLKCQRRHCPRRRWLCRACLSCGTGYWPMATRLPQPSPCKQPILHTSPLASSPAVSPSFKCNKVHLPPSC